MKRKFFTLLMAFMALAAFQVNAAPPTPTWWVRADISGNGPFMPYPGQKVPLQDWFTTTADGKIKLATEGNILLDNPNNNFEIKAVSGSTTAVRIVTSASNSTPNKELALKNLGEGEMDTDFTIAQFYGFNNDLVAMPNDYPWLMSGYLIPRQDEIGSKTAWNPELRMVLSNSAGDLKIGKLSDWCTTTFHPGQAPVPAVDAKFTLVNIGKPELISTQGQFTIDILGYDLMRITGTEYNYQEGQYYLKANYTSKGDVADYEYVLCTHGGGLVGKVEVWVPEIKIGSWVITEAHWADLPQMLLDQIPGLGKDLPTFVDLNGDPVTDLTEIYTPNMPIQDLIDAAKSSAELDALIRRIAGNVVGDLTADLLAGLDFKGAILAEMTDPGSGAIPWKPSYWTYAQKPGVDLHPVYVKQQLAGGRWATADDFDATCKFFSLPSNLDIEGAEKLIAEDEYVFAIDFVDCFMPTKTMDKTGLANPHNFGFGGSNNPWNNHVIPLFTLRSPDSDCEFLSVSRESDMTTQVATSKTTVGLNFELRPYGTTWLYKNGSKQGEKVEKDFLSPFLYGSTDLQKFAIWLDHEGNFTIYPAASYLYEFGESLPTQNYTFPDPTIVKNSALDYNVYPGSPFEFWSIPEYVERNFFQLGWYNGIMHNGVQIGNPDFAVIPLKLNTNTTYKEVTFTHKLVCEDIDMDEDAKFYYLQVYPTEPEVAFMKLNLERLGYTKDEVIKLTEKTDWVISTQTVVKGQVTYKEAVVIPKEWVNDTNPPQGYWNNNPRDSVNMAAHWGLYKTAAGMKIINMLGDELVMTPQGGAVIYNGELTVNNDISAVFNRGAAAGAPTYELNPRTTNRAKAGLWHAYSFTGATDKKFYLETMEGNSLVFDIFRGFELGQITTTNQSNVPNYYSKGVYPQIPLNVKGINLRDMPFQENPFFIDGHGWVPCKGIRITLEEIYYVPTYGMGNDGKSGWNYHQKFGTDDKRPDYVYYVEGDYEDDGDRAPKDDEVINTNDPNYYDAMPYRTDRDGKDGKIIMYKDSLTAYSYARGEFKIQEVRGSGNGHYVTKGLSSDLTTNFGDNNVYFRPCDFEKADIVEFIPYDLIAEERDAKVKDGYDKLFGDHYKWFIVKLKGENRYLRYDTLNLANDPEKEKVCGLTFKATDIYNATPIRMYQPLTRDKKDGNFVIQFYPAQYKYKANGDMIAPTNYLNKTTVHFGWFIDQTDIMYATINKANATRVRLVDAYVAPIPEACPDCYEDFVEPEWMAANRLLGMQVTAEAFVKDELKGDKIFYNDNRAILTKDNADHFAHFLAGYIYKGNYYHGKTKEQITLLNDKFTRGLIDKDKNDIYIPVYYVQVNTSDGYLTVQPKTDMKISDVGPQAPGSGGYDDPRVTDPDVTGVLLSVQPKWNEAQSHPDNKDYYMPTTQLFVITDNCLAGEVEGAYSRFVYYPLGSYTIDYNKGEIIKDAKGNNKVVYNTTLGLGDNCRVPSLESFEAIPDMRESFRIAQYSLVGSNLYSLIVTGATGNALTSNIPVEFAWTPRVYGTLCDDFAIRYLGRNGVPATDWIGTNGTFASKDFTASFSEETKFTGKELEIFPLNHYNWNDVKTDLAPYLVEFAPEIPETYGEAVEMSAYLNGYATEDGKNGYYVYNRADGKIDLYKFQTDDYFYPWTVADAATINYDVDPTFEVTCLEHQLPFYDLEADGGYNIEWQKLAAFEAIFLDRNMFTDWTKSSEIIKNGAVAAYQTKVKNVKPGEDDVVYMSVFRSNRRQLSPVDENHVIPYYNFMLTYKGDEYYLNVKPAAGLLENDSVRFTKLTAAEIAVLMDYEGIENVANINAMPNYKFCLPYAINDKDRVDASVDTPLYIQTLDTLGGNDYAPYLVIIGAGSDLVTARRVDKAVINPANFEWSIYTINYTRIQRDLSTSWTFRYQTPEDNEWVRLAEPVDAGEGMGILVNSQIPGYSQYVTASGEEPVNYARISGVAKDSELKVVFVGDTIIGEYHKRPIWYYRIIDPTTGDYLTDAIEETAAKYWFTWETTTNPYAYFGEYVESGELNAKEGIEADAKFLQAFGLKYTDDGRDVTGSDPHKFRVVSRANYHEKWFPSKEYRYLANVQGRYVFVDNPEYAMIFSWGQNEDGSFVGIDDVNTFTVVSLPGAINVKNAEGVVEIFTIDGRKVSSTPITSADQTIAAPAGIVVVKNGAKITRAIVK